jgi:hypothetical protein
VSSTALRYAAAKLRDRIRVSDQSMKARRNILRLRHGVAHGNFSILIER